MKLNLEFLHDVNLKNVEKTATRVVGINQFPTTGDIKVFRNGKIFFSEDFRIKVGDGGLDFVDSRKWNEYPTDVPQQLVFLCIVSDLSNLKLAAKVDVREESTNAPKAAVKKVLIPLLTELYNLDPNFSSVELKVNYDTALINDKGIYHIPKVVSSGKDKGEDTYTRRENVTFWPLTIIENEATVEEAIITEDIEEVVDLEMPPLPDEDATTVED